MSGRAQPPERLPGRPTMHGAYSRPTRSRRVRRARRRFVALLVDGHPEPSTREQLLISATADAMVRLTEANAFLDRTGLVGDGGQVAPVSKVYISLLNLVRRNIEALGLHPSAVPEKSLSEYLAEREQTAAPAHCPGSGKGDGGGGDVSLGFGATAPSPDNAHPRATDGHPPGAISGVNEHADVSAGSSAHHNGAESAKRKE